MPTILSNLIVEQVLSMPAVIETLEQAYQSWGQHQAISRPRSDSYLRVGPQALYVLKTMDGIDGPAQVSAIRLNSDILQWTVTEGKTRKEKVRSAPGARYNGMVLLFSTRTGELLAMCPDGVIQKMRVAATNALSVKYLARPDSRHLALIGTGWQASGAIEAITSLLPIQSVRVYSPTRRHREAFAQEWQQRLGLPVVAVASAREAVAGADIIGTCTNSIHRVLEADWLEPGCHLFCVKYVELGDAVRARAQQVVVNSQHPTPDNYVPGYGLVQAHDPVELWSTGTGKEPVADPQERWAEDVPALWQVMNGQATGRRHSDDITCFVNNIGIGLQFAAVGALALRLAQAQGLGIDVPLDWFVQTVHP